MRARACAVLRDCLLCACLMLLVRDTLVRDDIKGVVL